MSDDSWQVFDIEAIKSRLTGKSVEYREFLRVPTLSCGVYHLAAGSKDMQSPHDEDEVYYVVEGRARVKIGTELKAVSAGSVLFIPATETHSFFEIEQDMTLLVFFAAAS